MNTLAPNLILVFGTTRDLLASDLGVNLSAAYPHAALLACSTGTYLAADQLHDEAIAVWLIGFSRTIVRIASAPLEAVQASRETGRALATSLVEDDLAGVLIFSTGLEVNGTALLEGLAERLGPATPIAGGLAGDGPRFETTLVWTSSGWTTRGAVAVGLYGDGLTITQGAAGGWDAFGPLRQVTRSDGSILYELDGKPALELYERYLGEEAVDLPASGLLYPLQIWPPGRPDEAVVRTLLGVDRGTGAMILAGEIPMGWEARLMRGAFERLTFAAATAAQTALGQHLAIAGPPQFCLMVSCVGRRLLLGQRTDDEVESLRGVLGPRVEIAGMYSYGEIAPHTPAGAPGFHNQTVALTLFSEAA